MKKTILAGLIAATSIGAFAQDASTTQRDANQEQRIANGVKNGSLTTREAGTLERGQARDDRLQARAGRDGHVGAHEAARIAKREDRQSARIHERKHDAQKP